MEVEHGIVELLCPGCEKTGFPDKQTLRRHVKTYHGVKLPCEFCGKFFNEGNKMRRHVIEGKLIQGGPSMTWFFATCCPAATAAGAADV